MVAKDFQIEIEQEFPVPCRKLYRAWLSSEEHSAFTGGEAVIDPTIDGKFSAWDGYITGTTVSIEFGRRIVQTWRTTEFPENARNSMLELTIEPTHSGCKLILKQWDIPPDQVSQYASGWKEHYFKPMKAYFT